MCAVLDNAAATEEELRLCIVVLSHVNHFLKSDLQKLVDVIRDDKPTVKMRAEFARQTIERMFAAKKKPPIDWLSIADIPGTDENIRRMAFGKAVLKKATGIDL